MKAAIDFSMSSPGVVVVIDSTPHFLAISNHKKIASLNNDKFNLEVQLYPPYKNNIDRFDKLTDIIINFLIKHNVTLVNIEGYSYGSSGTVFEIGENTGIMKWKLLKNNIAINVISPASIKKYATGKGNASKIELGIAFTENIGINFDDYFKLSKFKSPFSDLVDAYYCYFCEDVYQTYLV